MFGRIAFSGLLLALPTMLFPPSFNSSMVGMGVCVAQDPTVKTSSAQPAVASTAGFRVVTDIYFGTKNEPAQQSLTLFSAGVAYDISFDDPNQITMVDPGRARIVLLNKSLQTQTAIDLNELQRFIDSARKAAETSELAEYLKGADKISVTDSGVSVGDSVLEYHTTLQQPREPHMAQQYAQAADAFQLLNGWRSGMPPFARLSLNRVVAEQHAIPQEITRTTSSGGGKQKDVVRCRLHTNWRLSKDDERQIADIGSMLVNYKQVPPAEFFAALGKPAATANAAGPGSAPK